MYEKKLSCSSTKKNKGKESGLIGGGAVHACRIFQTVYARDGCGIHNNTLSILNKLQHFCLLDEMGKCTALENGLRGI